MIKEKLGEMVARIYALESMSYRTSGLIDAMLKGIDRGAATTPKQTLEALQEYAVECSILKVVGTETLDFMADEAVQIFGGYGFCSGYDVERAYRDQRVNRIFEGTNEINRLLITDMLMKRSMKGQLPLLAAAQMLTDEILGMAPIEFMLGLEQEQEVVAVISNLVMAVYSMESALLRTQKKLSKSGASGDEADIAAARVCIHAAADHMEMEARRALARIAEGDTLRTHLSVLRRFLRRTPPDSVGLKRQLADRALEINHYPFGW